MMEAPLLFDTRTPAEVQRDVALEMAVSVAQTGDYHALAKAMRTLRRHRRVAPHVFPKLLRLCTDVHDADAKQHGPHR